MVRSIGSVGRYSRAEASSRSLPSSTRSRMSTARNVLLMLPTANAVSGVTLVPAATLDRPLTPRQMEPSGKMTVAETPGMALRARSRSSDAWRSVPRRGAPLRSPSAGPDGEAEAENPREPPDAWLAGPRAVDQTPLRGLAELLFLAELDVGVGQAEHVRPPVSGPWVRPVDEATVGPPELWRTCRATPVRMDARPDGATSNDEASGLRRGGPVLDRPERGLCSAGQAQLAEDVGDV